MSLVSPFLVPKNLSFFWEGPLLPKFYHSRISFFQTRIERVLYFLFMVQMKYSA